MPFDRPGLPAIAVPAAAFFITATVCQAQAPFKDLSIEIKDTSSDGRYAVWMMPPKLLEATLNLSSQTENMTLSRSTPFTMDVDAKRVSLKRATCILQARQTVPNQQYQFHWHYDWKTGLRGGKPDPTAIYSLPFDTGTRCTVNQGYFGKYSHGPGSQEEYAIDFNQPEGTPIRAAREGVVVAVRQDSNVGGSNAELYKQAGNYVVIKHADGTYGSYVHIKQNSAMVRLGEKVKRGEHIARVGATGYATCPHLHFDVSVPQSGVLRATYPVKFDSASGIIDKPIQGETYIAK